MLSTRTSSTVAMSARICSIATYRAVCGRPRTADRSSIRVAALELAPHEHARNHIAGRVSLGDCGNPVQLEGFADRQRGDTALPLRQKCRGGCNAHVF